MFINKPLTEKKNNVYAFSKEKIESLVLAIIYSRNYWHINEIAVGWGNFLLSFEYIASGP